MYCCMQRLARHASTSTLATRPAHSARTRKSSSDSPGNRSVLTRVAYQHAPAQIDPAGSLVGWTVPHRTLIRAAVSRRGMLLASHQMESVTNANFGPLIAYLVPGATVLVGFSQFSPVLRSWFGASPADSPTIGGFLYLTVASIAVGMTLNALRWALIDTVHAYTGLPVPSLDFSRLGKNVEAFALLIEIHYRHYQFMGSTLLACGIAYTCYRVKLGGLWPLGWLDLAFVVLEVIFFITSRDCLRRYYARSQQLLMGDANPDSRGVVARHRAPTPTDRGNSTPRP